MIIISQDKKKIINFEQALEIHVVRSNEIIVETDNMTVTIGKYKTEERAKEVLQEIIKASVGKLIVQVQADLPDEALIKLNKQHEQEAFYYDLKTEIKQMTNTIVYRMPEE